MIGPLTDRQNALDDPSSISAALDNNNQNEEQQLEKFELPIAPENYGSRSIPLSYLLDFAIQFTYHEFTVLTELLQKKSESDRKISLAHFARSTRLIFLKLFAVVKWAKKSKKFEQLENICFFLDQQSEYFVETADRFVHVARAELLFAGLPLYQVAKATDVLSNGSYTQVPQAIKKKHIQEKSLTKRQHSLTLRSLNASIQYRLIQEAAHLPAGITRVEIRNGMAIFTAANQFVLKMTIFPANSEQLANDSVDAWRWFILDVDILIADYEIGFGSSLVHPSQKQPLIALCQAQINRNQHDIANIYKILHEFCVKLQLDVFFCQADQLSSTVSRSYVSVERYDPRKSFLNITYWNSQSNSSQYSFKIERSRTSFSVGLKLHHHPFNINLPSLNDSGSNFYQIFNETIRVRCQEQLQKVRDILAAEIPTTSHIYHQQTDQHLILKLLPTNDLSTDEMLKISISAFSGKVKCRLKELENEPTHIESLEVLLNNDFYPDPTALKRCLQKMQIQLMQKRYKEAIGDSRLSEFDVQHFPALDHLKKLPQDKLCLRLSLEPKIFLAISFDLNNGYDAQVQYTKFDFNGTLLKVTTLNPQNLIDFDDTKDSVFACDRKQIQQLLASIMDVSLLEQITFELERNKVRNEIQRCGFTNEHMIKLKSFVSILDKESNRTFDRYVDCVLRQTNDTWFLECSLKGSIPAGPSSDCILRNRIRTHVEELTVNQRKDTSTGILIANQIIEHLKGYSLLHDAFKDFILAYEQYFKQECTITHCAYNRLCLSYGETRNNMLSILYRPKAKNFMLTFMPSPPVQNGYWESRTSYPLLWNPHLMLNNSINDWFNKDRNLNQLTQYLIDTHLTCLSIYNFSAQRLRSLKAYSQMMGNDEKNFSVELQSFVLVVSPTQIRIVCGVIHLEFYLLSANRVILDSCIVINKRRHVLESVPLFFEFWHLHSRGSVVVAQKTNMISGLNALEVFKNEDFDSMSPLTPHSNTQRVSTPTPTANQKISPPTQRPISAPEVPQLGTPPKQESTSNSTLQSLLLDSSALNSAMLTKTNPNYTSPFDEYLRSINFFSTVGWALSQMTKDKKPQFPLTAIRFGLDFIEMSAVALSHPGLTVDPWSVRIYLYLCNQTFTTRCNLTFSGVYVPDEQFVQVFERYFESRIVPQHNEMEVLSFVTACRIMADGIFQSIAQIMEHEMITKENEWNPNMPRPHWKTNLLLSVLTPVSSAEKLNLQAQNRRFIAGLMINESCKHLLITLSIRAAPLKRNQKGLAKRVELVYILANNSITTRNVFTGQRPSETDRKTVEAIMTEANTGESTECRIWPAIKLMLDKYRP